MKSRYLIPVAVFAFAALLINGCNKKKKETEDPNDPSATFDKKAMLVNIADNVILPSYNSFKNSLDSLVIAYNNFKASNSPSDFQIVKQKFATVYLKYQRCDLYEFGPAETVSLRNNSNIFPADTAKITSNIDTGSYDFNTISNIPAKGLPALDFLFYGKNTSEAGIIQRFADNNRKQYVTDILNEMSGKINSIISNWSTYHDTFTNSLGTDVGSSIGFLVNQLNFQLDYLKNAKVGIPLGKKSLGIMYPEKCEAYYSTAYSLQFAIETLTQIENIYLGRGAAGTDGKGFDDYIEHLNLQSNGGSLNTAIKNQFGIAKNKLSALSSPLSGQFAGNTTAVDAAYMELVKLLVLLKTDMPSGLGVVITYQDGDGD
jgi:uncharacterized protein